MGLIYIFRRTPSYPQRQCYFCQIESVILPPFQPDIRSNPSDHANNNIPSSASASTSALTISTGSANNWFCSSCQCWNTFDEQGRFRDQWLRPMWDADWNRDRSSLARHTAQHKDINRSSNTDQQDTTASSDLFATARNNDRANIFCHTCLTNQTLQINLLANYLPDEGDPEYPSKLQSLPEYQTSIATRYPSVCNQCAPQVEHLITERDRLARSWSLGQWLSSANAAVSSVAKSEPIPNKSSNPPSASEPRRARLLSELRWYRSLVCWSLSSATFWIAYAYCFARPSTAIDTLLILDYLANEEPLSSLSLSILVGWLLLVLCLFAGRSWDPTALRINRAKARGIRPHVIGLDLWIRYQQLIFFGRLLLLIAILLVIVLVHFVPPLSSLSESLIVRSSATFLIADLVLLFLAISKLSVRMPVSLRLISQPLDIPPPPNDFLSSLSLSSSSLSTLPSPPSSLYPFATATSITPRTTTTFTSQPPPPSIDAFLQSQQEDTDEPMPPVHPESYPIELGKQQFWGPQSNTGLEDVFGKAVRLDDDDDVPSRHSQNNWKRWFGLDT